MKTNDELVRELIRSGYLRTPLIIEAFRAIDRRNFVLDEYAGEAYGNEALPIGFGQTTSQPLTVAFMLELLAPQPGDFILEIGTGSGWQTALLAHIVSSSRTELGGAKQSPLDFLKPKKPRAGKVVSIERIPELYETARGSINTYKFIDTKAVELIVGDGAKGYKREAPFSKVIAGATSGTIPVAWKEQCRDKGRIVAPVGETVEVHDKISPNDYIMKEYVGFRFVPLVIDDAGGG